MKTSNDYNLPAIEACLMVMRELFTYLKPYRNQIALVGGWVPYFLLGQYSDDPSVKHVGSLDIDVLLDSSSIPDTAYATILEILQKRGFLHRVDRLGREIPASFVKKVTLETGEEVQVQVDFLAPEYGGSAGSRRHQVVQEMLARKGRGTDIVFTHTELISLSGVLSNRAHVECDMKVADLAACFIMKGIALGERTSEKDAYDLYMLARYYKSGPKSVVADLEALKGHGLMKEAMANIEKEFASVNSLGPVSVAEFLRIIDETERERSQRDAYEIMQFISTQMKQG